MAPKTLEGQALGKYQILEPLGRGGMAQVYRAYHAQLDRYVAVKVLRSDLVGEQEFLARFSREARSVASLRHPNIVQVFDFDVQDDFYYMVMELMEGDTLKAHLSGYRSRGEKMPVSEIARILTDVLNGLAYAHGEGIIHRDVKPANILLTRRGQAVITDFGIAQIVGGTNYTISGALMGTLHYMAPEQGMGTNVDGRSDLYSLGVVLYEILTGHPPFDADTPLAILMKHLNDPLPLPRGPEAISAPFERVVLKALSKKPEDRYQTAAEMTRALCEAAAACEGGAQNGTEALGFLSQPEESGSAAGAEAAGAEAAGAEGELLEPPQVYSGTSKQNITDLNFAADVTDMNLDEHLKAENLAAGGAVLNVQAPQDAGPAAGSAIAQEPVNLSTSFDEVVKSASKLFSTVGGVISVALVSAAEEVKQTETTVAKAVHEDVTTGSEQKATTAAADEAVLGIAPLDESDGLVEQTYPLPAVEEEEPYLQPHRVSHAALIGAGALVGANLLAVGVGVSTGWWGLYTYGWPAEMMLIALLLLLLMGSLSNIMLLIPAGILLGNGMIFSYYSLTGNWWLWGLLWPFEPLLIGASIYIPIKLARTAPRQSALLARRFGWPLAIVTGGLVLLVGLGSMIATLIRTLLP